MLTLILWLLVAGVAAFILYSHFIEPERLELTRVRIRVSGLPSALEGLTIAHLSDLHIKGPDHPYSHRISSRAVALAVAEDPDLVCLTGDLGQASRHVERAADLLRPLSHKPFFVVMGNHDHDKMLESESFGPPDVRVTTARWREVVAARGPKVLLNQCAMASVNGHSVAVAGVGDPSCGWDNLAAALDGSTALASADPALRLLLVHSPDLLDDPLADWADLVLCGHTHGGQLRLPGLGCPWAPVWRDRRRSEGLIQVGNAVCYVSRDVAAGIRTRFRCRPQLVVITLTAGEGDEPLQLPRLPLP